MKIKTQEKNKYYIDARINRYSEYKSKLFNIFRKNRNLKHFSFYGVREIPRRPGDCLRQGGLDVVWDRDQAATPELGFDSRRFIHRLSPTDP